MKKIRFSVEFAIPEIPDALSGEEREAVEEGRRLFPGRVLGEVMRMLSDAGMEITAFQNQEVKDSVSVLAAGGRKTGTV